MKHYSEYKSSGKEWIGEYPANWIVVRNKYLFREVETRSETGKETLLSLTKEKGLIPQTEYSDRGSSAETLVGYRLCSPGQIVMNRMQAWNGMFSLVRTPGLVSPDYTVFQPIRDINLEFILYLFKTQKMIGIFHQRSRGIGTGFMRLYTPDFGDVAVALPPLIEQEAIVAFLNQKLTEIDRFITKKERLITLLREQKAVIINRTVTRGIDLDVPMKQSGIEWLGEIPRHWEVTRARYYFKEIDDRSEEGKEELLSVSHITGVTPRSEKNVTMFMAESYAGSKTCQPGDLVINIMWAWMGALGVSEYGGIVSSSYGVYRQKQKLFNWQYLDYLLKTRPYVAEFTCRSTGIRSSRLRMYTEDFFGVPIIRPSLDEQERIVHYIEQEHAQIDDAISSAEREIDLIKEIRTALISEAVTGKIDVYTFILEEDLNKSTSYTSEKRLETLIGASCLKEAG